MIFDKVIGSLTQEEYRHLKPDYVSFEWYEMFKKVHRKTTESGIDIGLQLGNEVLTTGLNQDDIFHISKDGTCIAVNILPCEVICISPTQDHDHMLIKAAYEIGNRHATAFWGDSKNQIITPFHPVLFQVLEHIHGISLTIQVQQLDFNKRISATVNNHTH